VHQLAERCGWANITAFQRHQDYWRKGLAHRRALTPLAYLKAIGIDWCELIQAVERDGRDYDAALEAMPEPDSFIVNRRPSLGVTFRVQLPSGLTREERSSHVQQLADTNAFAECNALVLDWPGMKQVWFRAHLEPKEYLWRPSMTLVQESIDFGEPWDSDKD